MRPSRLLFALLGAVGLAAALSRCVGDDSGPLDASSLGDAGTDGNGSVGDALPASDVACETTLCGGSCTDTATDPSNCGACGNACAEGLACAAGRCGTVVDVATSTSAACALRSDGSVWCWGSTAEGETGVTPAVGVDPKPNRVGISTLTTAVEIAGAADYFCARQSDGSIYCWGGGDEDELGHPSSSDATCADPRYSGGTHCSSTPQAVNLPAGVVPKSLSLGVGAACVTAASADGGTGDDLYCWGTALIAGGTTTAVPTRISALAGRVQRVSLGILSACAVLVGGEVDCWGFNYYGVLGHLPGTHGDDAFNTNPTPTSVFDATDQPISGFNAVRVAAMSACGRKQDDSIWCWGSGYTGELGVGPSGATGTSHLAAAVAGLATTDLLAASGGWQATAGSGAILVRAKDGTTRAFGDNTLGELATGNVFTNATCSGLKTPCAPSPVKTSSTLDLAARVSMAGGAGAALLPDGQVLAWGDNSLGVLGHAPGQQGDLACALPTADAGVPCNPTPGALPPLP